MAVLTVFLKNLQVYINVKININLSFRYFRESFFFFPKLNWNRNAMKIGHLLHILSPQRELRILNSIKPLIASIIEILSNTKETSLIRVSSCHRHQNFEVFILLFKLGKTGKIRKEKNLNRMGNKWSSEVPIVKVFPSCLWLRLKAFPFHFFFFNFHRNTIFCD